MHTVKVGDTIECVHNIHREQHLTIAKHYLVQGTYNGYSKRQGRVDIIDDSGNLFNCGHWRFIAAGRLVGNPVKLKSRYDVDQPNDIDSPEIDFLEILRGY